MMAPFSMNGMKVMVEGNVSIYIPRGQYQLRTRNLYLAGKGDLWQQYEALKQKNHLNEMKYLFYFYRAFALYYKILF